MFFKKISTIFIILLSFFSLFSFSLPVLAAGSLSDEVGKQLGAAAGEKGAGFSAPEDPRAIVSRVIRIILGLLGTVFFVLTLYAGYLWMTAAGNEDQVGKAKTLLTQAVIGLAILLGAYSITIFATRLALGQGGLDYGNSVYITPAPQPINPSPY